MDTFEILSLTSFSILADSAAPNVDPTGVGPVEDSSSSLSPLSGESTTFTSNATSNEMTLDIPVDNEYGSWGNAYCVVA